MEVPYIPLFNIKEGLRGEGYPMLYNLGKGNVVLLR